MIGKLAAKFTAGLERNQIIDEESREVYIYGFEILISTVLNFLLVLALALLFRRPLDAAIYMLCTGSLRTTGGGWHADSHILCMTLHALAFSLVSWLSFAIWSYVPWFALVLILIISMAIVLIKAPAEHPNNPLEHDVKMRIRRRCIIYMVLISISVLVFWIFGQHHLSVLTSISSVSAVLTFLVSNKEK